MIMLNNAVLAVDFDGTIVEDKYPKIGEPRTFAFETLRMLQEEGFRLILWTYRSGVSLQEAVDFCKENGIVFYAVNKNFPEEVFDAETPRKLAADIFIDDRNVGGFPGWGKIYQMLTRKEISEMAPPPKKSLLGGLFKR